jgi:sortase A
MTATDVAVPVEPRVAAAPAASDPNPLGRRARRLEADAVGRTTETRARRPIRPGKGAAAWVLATISFLALWFVVYAIVLTPFQQSRQQAVLYDTVRERLAQQTAPLGGVIKPGVPVAVITAPSLGIADLVVVEGTASGDLMAGPGHRRDSVLPGQAGIAVIYGRSALFGAPFAGLAAAHAGDTLTATTGQGVFSYVVEGRRRAGDHFPAPLAADGSRLTLASAVGSGRFGDLSPTETVYVDLRLTGQSQPSPSGRAVQVPLAERAMQGDPSALLPLALALPLLIGSLLFVVWARARWGAWQTWLVGMPLVLAALWAVSQAAVQLLPNLL